tara:strand:+ start:31093 stop:31263 length:171 start_codon:yes stop_codon:yes gene_type:complete
MDDLISVALIVIAVFAAYSVGVFLGADIYQPLIDMCELELTRNQSCVLIAVPEVIK